jgi:hypothetical protein
MATIQEIQNTLTAGAYWPIVSVLASSVLAVFRVSTLFW